MKSSFFAILLAGFLLLTACQPATAVPSTPGDPDQIPATGSTSSPSAAEKMAQLSIAALSQQFGVPEARIKVLEVTPMTWLDASLGCPKRGVLYIQRITPGFQMRLEAGGQTYEFHTDESELVVSCEQPAPSY